MGYAIELVLDEAGAAVIGGLRADLGDAGVPSLAARIGDEPHVSLGVFDDEVDLDVLCSAVRGFANDTSPIDLSFSSLGLFPPDGWVLFAAPKPDTRLLEVHGEMLLRLGDLNHHLERLYRPDRWVPHCTIEMEIPRDALAAAVLAATENFEPFEATAESIAVVAFRPVEVLDTFPLGS